MSGGWTKGPWTIGTDTQPSELCTIHGLPTQPTEDGKGQTWVYIHHPRVIDREWYWPTPEEKLRSAELIIEAGTVANETGLTPRQLADQRAELLEIAKYSLVMMSVLLSRLGAIPMRLIKCFQKPATQSQRQRHHERRFFRRN